MNIEERISREIRTIINPNSPMSSFNRAVDNLRFLVWIQDNPATYESIRDLVEAGESKLSWIKSVRDQYGLSLDYTYRLYKEFHGE